MRHALIDNGTVVNVIELRPDVVWPGAVALQDRPVGIGDSYQSGKFFRDGNEVLTTDEENALLKAALKTLGVETEDAESPAE